MHAGERRRGPQPRPKIAPESARRLHNFRSCDIGAMLLWPLITPGVLPGRFNVTPAPPYRGGGDAVESRSSSPAHPPANISHRPRFCLLCPPPVIPNHVRTTNETAGASLDDAPSIGDGGTGGLTGDGPLIPGGFDGGKPAMEIRRPGPPPRPAPLRMSEGVMEAALIHKVQPSYPAIARAMHLAGTCVCARSSPQMAAFARWK